MMKHLKRLHKTADADLGLSSSVMSAQKKKSTHFFFLPMRVQYLDMKAAASFVAYATAQILLFLFTEIKVISFLFSSGANM